jgi:hypothetical protein
MFFLLAAVCLLVGLAGCRCPHAGVPGQHVCGSCADAPETCRSCGPAMCKGCGGRGCGLCRRGQPRADATGDFTPGPPVGAVTYPYYTIRGPRDFLAKNPPSIGP